MKPWHKKTLAEIFPGSERSVVFTVLDAKVPAPHLLVVLDIGWVGIRAGAAYYSIQDDRFRPAFVDIIFLNRWRVNFEFGAVSRIWAP